MIYRVDYLGKDERGRMRLRGTGFCPDIGGFTLIAPDQLDAMMWHFAQQLEANETATRH